MDSSRQRSGHGQRQSLGVLKRLLRKPREHATLSIKLCLRCAMSSFRVPVTSVKAMVTRGESWLLKLLKCRMAANPMSSLAKTQRSTHPWRLCFARRMPTLWPLILA